MVSERFGVPTGHNPNQIESTNYGATPLQKVLHCHYTRFLFFFPQTDITAATTRFAIPALLLFCFPLQKHLLGDIQILYDRLAQNLP